jgi:hypothetical protein
MGTVGQRAQWRSTLPDDLDADAVKKFIDDAYLADDATKLQTLRSYLGFFEALAVAVASEVYDIRILDSMDGTRIRRIAANYKPYFERARSAANAPSLYAELEWLGRHLEALGGTSGQYVLIADR